MNGGTVTSNLFVANVPTSWSIVGASGRSILWRDNVGNTAIWLMNGGQVASNVYLGTVPTSWSIVGTGDFNGDGNLDILWRDNTGNVAIWLLDNTGHVTSICLSRMCRRLGPSPRRGTSTATAKATSFGMTRAETPPFG